MIVLGINDSHDASACLLKDGRILAAASEERFQRIKSVGGYPKNAIEHLLKDCGISARDIDHVAVATKFIVPTNLYDIATSFSIKDYFRLHEEYYYPRLYENKNVSLKEVFPNYKMKGKAYYPIEEIPFATTSELDREAIESLQGFRKSNIAKLLGVSEDIIEFYDHHHCHAYFAYYSSPQKAARTTVVTSDSGGDSTYSLVGVFENGRFSEVARNRNNIIGKLYTITTLLLGMRPNEHEYKVMGLAPYASEYNRAGPREIFLKALKVEGLDFVKDPEMKDFFRYLADRLKAYRFDAISGGLQDFVEARLTEWFRNIHQATGCRDFVFAGGVANNVKATKRIIEQDFVDSFYVPPGPGDESLSMGACYIALEKNNTSGKQMFDVIPLNNAYLGPQFPAENLAEFAAHPFITQNYDCEDLNVDRVAEFLAAGEVVGVLQGRMEFGCRALGQRSLIADPSNPGMIKKINDLIKKRDFWMPFTPSVLDEHYDEYIVNPKKIASNYMTLTFDSTQKAKTDLVSAVHPYDYTVRPQRVTKRDNPGYHQIISAFKRRTGVGAVLNTSLNIHGRPIVYKPTDLLKEILLDGEINLDYIVIDQKFFVRKRKVQP